MSIDWQAIKDAGGIGKGTPRAVAKLERQRRGRKALDDAYTEVDARDKLVSWVSGTTLRRGSTNDRLRLEHHHMARRSRAKSRIGDPYNVISVSAREAEYLDTHALRPVNAAGEEVTDVRQIVRFTWNPAMVGDTPPFRLPARAWHRVS